MEPLRSGVRIERDGYLPATERLRPGERIEVTLQPGVPVRGRIVRVGVTEGDARAEVVVLEQDLGLEIAAFTTDADGAFEIPAVRPHRPFLMVVRLSGLVPQTKRLVVDSPTDDLEVLVGEGGRLTGLVREEDGTPIADAAVTLETLGALQLGVVRPELARRIRDAQEAASAFHVTTDKGGRYEFLGVPLHTTVRPVARLGDRHVVRGRIESFEEPGESREVHLVATAPATLRIRVRDEGGAAIGDADIEVHGPTGEILRPLPSDARNAGDLLMAGLPGGSYEVVASRPGAPTQRADGDVVDGGETLVSLTFPRGRPLSGTVRDKHGTPIWKALVTWTAQDERVEVRTDIGGGFLFQRLAHETGTITVSARDLPVSRFAYESFVVEEVPAPGPPLEITLKDGPRAHGTFVDLPAGQEVRCQLQPGTSYDQARLLPAEDGAFTCRGPPPGQGALFVFETQGLPPILRRESAPFQSEENRDLGPLHFQATNPRKGRVLGEDGRPIWSARITLRAPWANRNVRTDRDGDFTLAHLPRLPFAIWIEAEGYSATPETLRPASEFKPQVFRLRKTIELRISVRAGRRGAPAALAISGTSPGTIGRSTPLRKETDGRGRATVRLPPGHYEITVRNPTSGAKRAHRLTVTAEAHQALDVALP